MNLPSPTEISALAGACVVAAGLVLWLLKDVRLTFEIGMVAAFLFMCAGVAHTYKQQGVDEQVAIDKPALKAAAENLAQSEQNVATAETDLAALRAAGAIQNQAVSDLHAQLLAKTAEVAAAKAAGNAKAQQYQDRFNSYVAQTTGPPSPGDQCAKADSVLRSLAADLVRDD